ncbi:MAG: hypothetical protein EOO27_42800, partial [Comamonadaceae bacterium]
SECAPANVSQIGTPNAPSEKPSRCARTPPSVLGGLVLIAADLMNACAPQVSPVLMQALVRTESGGRPFAIGMDRAHGSVRQPTTLQEAVATARALASAGRQFSVGLAQIHISNVTLHRLSWEQAFDPCQNLATAQKILWEFYRRASASGYSGSATLWAALRGYNSGGVHRTVSDGYANRVLAYVHGASPQVSRTRSLTIPAIGTDAQPSPAGAYVAPARPLPPKSFGESPDIFARANATGL